MGRCFFPMGYFCRGVGKRSEKKKTQEKRLLGQFLELPIKMKTNCFATNDLITLDTKKKKFGRGSKKTKANE